MSLVREPSLADEQFESLIAHVRGEDDGLSYIYKTRRLRAAEYLEIEDVLERLRTISSHVPCSIVRYDIEDNTRRLHLLCERIVGVSLDHLHRRGEDETWLNDPDIIDVLSRIDMSVKYAWVAEITDWLEDVHRSGLRAIDLKVEQLMYTDDLRIRMVDLDQFALATGWRARTAFHKIHSAALPQEQFYSVESDRRQLIHLAHELCFSKHLRDVAVAYAACGITGVSGDLVKPRLMRWLQGCHDGHP